MNYFEKKEFACKCGCGFDQINVDFINRLNVARYIAGVPFVINSGCICHSHNIDVGGSNESEHLIGCASDIEATNSRTRFKIIHALIKAGFKRIGIRKDFIHVGIDPSKDKEVIWLY